MGQFVAEEIQPGLVTRRAALGLGGLCLGRLLLPAPLRGEPSKERPIQPFSRYADLLELLKKRNHKLRVLGYAPDGSPVVAVKMGGSKRPAIFISAGAHSTEQAGVTAAVELIDRLPTKHEAWVIPTRDPIGLNGYRYALSLGLGKQPELASLDELDTLLRKEGEVLLDADDLLVVQIGDYGYANRGLYRRVEKGAAWLEPLKGRRVYYPSRADDMPGAGPLERAYTLVVTPEGEVLHLNRFHDTAWAPSEVRCARRLMAEVKPGLCFDLHEHGGDAFWMSARGQRTDEDEQWERRLAHEAIRTVTASGARLAADSYSPGSFFEKLAPGLFWLDPGARGEGLNLIDFAARHHGPGFTIETGMRGDFAQRVQQHLMVVQSAVALFEQRY